jgi:carboxyl-terminal processing protease
LTTEDIAVQTVHAELLPDIKTCFVKIDYFARGTYREFMQAVESYFENGQAKHLILDLRGNPGGYIPEATNILCQIFKEKEKILFTTRNRNHKTYEYKSTGKQFFEIDQVVVLIDAQTASASEILAGSVQDWDRGIIIGNQSYGKGMVQEQYPLQNGGSIRLSVEKYYLPSGRSIQKPSHLSANVLKFEKGVAVSESETSTNPESAYKTLVLGRQVEAYSGISPDIQVGDKPLSDQDTHILYELLKSFTFAYATKNRSVIPTDKPSLQDWKMPADAFIQFEAYIAGEAGMDQIPQAWNEARFLKAFKEETAALISTQQGTDIKVNRSDAYVEAAIAAIKEKKAALGVK